MNLFRRLFSGAKPLIVAEIPARRVQGRINVWILVDVNPSVRCNRGPRRG